MTATRACKGHHQLPCLAGILAGKKATAHPAFSAKLSNQEAVDQRVVVDGKLVTSR
jgi:4-methyl-5(b-hydroxyethyl)-thiazole monophosphate biosynthesis